MIARMLTRLGLSFQPSLESAFDQHYRRSNTTVARFALLSGLVLNLTYGYLDVLLGHEFEGFLLIVRYLLITPLLCVIALLTYTRLFERYFELVLGSAALVTSVGIATSIAVAFDDVGHAYFFGIIIVNLYAQAFSRMRFVSSLFLALLNAVILNAAYLFVAQPVTFEYVVTVNYFLFTTIVLGAAVSYSLERAQRQDFLQARSLSDSNRELERNSRTDPLTGLPNRRCLTEDLARLAERVRNGGGRYTVLLVDIDHFKKINDTYGHDCGDKVLQRFALTLRRYLRGADIVGRWGGEEFLVVLPNAQGPGARLAALKLNRAIRETSFTHEGKRLAITATFGVAEGGSGTSVDEVIRRADAALYEGKRAGRDTVILNVETHETLKSPLRATE
ncbi:MAG: GGDEF domain-containing protein [Gammaproteobacteria bacterium]|nr:GGDEF domain-containing protein [Gammaproteobacteria bacterium]